MNPFKVRPSVLPPVVTLVKYAGLGEKLIAVCRTGLVPAKQSELALLGCDADEKGKINHCFPDSNQFVKEAGGIVRAIISKYRDIAVYERYQLQLQKEAFSEVLCCQNKFPTNKCAHILFLHLNKNNMV